MLLNKFVNLPPRKRMGILAIFLGVLAVFADNPYNNASVKVNLKDLALTSINYANSVKIDDLSSWIIQGKMNYRLIDLRKEEDFASYHIPSSENVKIEHLLDYGLARNEKILLYSDDNSVAAQGWFLLKASGYKGITILDGGLNGWKENVLFPACTCGENPSIEQQHKHNKMAEVSKFFGGNIQSDTKSNSTANFEMTEISAPNQIILKQTKSKKKREGC